MRRSIFLLALICLPALTQATAQRRTFSMDESPLGKSLSTLPAPERDVIRDVIRRDIQKWPEDDRLKADEMSTALRDLHFRRIDTDHGPLLFVQGWGDNMCGAVGNCRLWVLSPDHRLLLAGAGGKRVTISRTYHYSLPDLLVVTHDSASEDSDTLWRFDGHRYHETSCYYFERGDIEPYKHPHVTYVSCSTWQ